jgi:alpha-ketoglutarate-dependent taurine dioxygenase
MLTTTLKKSPLAQRISNALNGVGWVLIPDFEPTLAGEALAQAYLTLCEEIGQPIGHDRQGTIIWDIKARGAGGDDNKVITYSEHNHEADLHTDSQYSEYPEDYFGLLTLRKARCGGGESYLLSLDDLLKELASTTAGREAIEVLRTTNYPFIVPNVFRKRAGDDPEFNFGPVLRNGEIRFRIDTFEKALAAAPNLCTPRQLSAFNLLKQCIRSSASMKTFFLEDRDLIFINNKTMLHGRGSFTDADRHLLRIRMNKHGWSDNGQA